VVFVERDPDCNPATAITGLGTLEANEADRDCDGNVDPGEDRDGVGGFLAADAILQTRGPLSGGTTLRGNNNVVNRVTFNSQGMTPGSTGTLKLCDSRGYRSSREIITAFTGRVHVCKLTTQGCDTPAGTFLTTCTP
jgi:Tfp pilus assembly protein FimT